MMDHKIVELPSFTLMGLAVRTINANGQSGKDIKKLWEDFFQTGMADKVTGKSGEHLYCLYTEYESDASGLYTAILGYKVKEDAPVPEELVIKTIPAAKFRVYTSRGKLPQAVLATWEKIWATEIDRRYLADFDVYDPNSLTSSAAEVQTYLSVF